MTETRIVKIVMVGSLALLAGLVTFDNLIDCETSSANRVWSTSPPTPTECTCGVSSSG